MSRRPFDRREVGGERSLLASPHRALNGFASTFEEMSADFLCSICCEIFSEAYITRCGHTFCYQCIFQSIETHRRCPTCGATVQSTDQIFPNFALNELIMKYKDKFQQKQSKSDFQQLRDIINSESKKLALPAINIMLGVLQQRKQLLEAESCMAQNKILHDFLAKLLKLKEASRRDLNKEINLIKNDIVEIENIIKEVQSSCPNAEEIQESLTNENDENVISMKKEIIELIDSIESTSNIDASQSGVEPEGELPQGFNQCVTELNHAILNNRIRRINTFFPDLSKCYFEARNSDLQFQNDVLDTTNDSDPKMATSTMCVDDNPSDNPTRYVNTKEGLDTFRESIYKFSKYHGLRSLATLNYATYYMHTSTIVSSIEFDKDNEYFATGGVTKRIKIFDYLNVIRDAVDLHYPCTEMLSDNKISCVVWNAYHKGCLASSDYEGALTIWDVETGQKVKMFEEHGKRCWSVDFNKVDIKLIASGSDDTKVKLWNLDSDRSVATLEAKANVCCVKFNPKSSFHVAFGSADHCVHYYDLRFMKEPLCLFKGHKKAVSYVKFLNSNEIISASTDSQLKLWNVNSPPYTLRSYRGHINEKNFVGLATDGDYITCGSEDNSLHVYYKNLPHPLFNIKLDSMDVDVGNNTDSNEFVSAVCWRNNSNVIVAANSHGIIKILEMV